MGTKCEKSALPLSATNHVLTGFFFSQPDCFTNKAPSFSQRCSRFLGSNVKVSSFLWRLLSRQRWHTSNLLADTQTLSHASIKPREWVTPALIPSACSSGKSALRGVFFFPPLFFFQSCNDNGRFISARGGGWVGNTVRSAECGRVFDPCRVSSLVLEPPAPSLTPPPLFLFYIFFLLL